MKIIFETIGIMWHLIQTFLSVVFILTVFSAVLLSIATLVMVAIEIIT